MTTSKPVFRFKLCEELIEYMEDFAYLHKDDDRNDFKEAWNTWKSTDKICSLIESENERLSGLGYRGDLEKKIYTSVRYYYRKKAKNGLLMKSGKNMKKPAEVGATGKREDDTNRVKKQAKRSHYIHVSKDILNTIDEFICQQLKLGIYKKPAEYYAIFSENYRKQIQDEVETLRNIVYYNRMYEDVQDEIRPQEKAKDKANGFSLTNEEITDKLKKTFKNRYFVLLQNKS